MTPPDRAALVEKLRLELRRPPYPHDDQYGVGWFDAITAVLSLLSAEPERPERPHDDGDYMARNFTTRKDSE